MLYNANPPDTVSIVVMDRTLKMYRACQILMELKLKKERKIQAFRELEWASRRVDLEGLDQLSSEEVPEVKST